MFFAGESRRGGDAGDVMASRFLERAHRARHHGHNGAAPAPRLPPNRSSGSLGSPTLMVLCVYSQPYVNAPGSDSLNATTDPVQPLLAGAPANRKPGCTCSDHPTRSCGVVAKSCCELNGSMPPFNACMT